MLSTHDAEVVHRDKAIPGLGIVLDESALLALLTEALPEANLESARAIYVRYKPGTNCLVGYELVAGGRRVEAYAKAFRFDAHAPLGKAEGVPALPGPLGPGRVVFKREMVMVCVFPNDGTLKSLPRLSGGEEWQRLVRRLFKRRPDLWDGTVEGIRYKPERRYVARLVAGGEPRAALKIYTEGGYPQARANSGHFASRGELVVPRTLGRSDRRYALAFEWLGGRLLSDALADPWLDLSQMEVVGAALAEVHAHDPAPLQPLLRETEASSLLSVAAGLSFLCPDLAWRVNDLARYIAAQLMEEPPHRVAVHGDFYAKQVILLGDRAAILDFDTAAAGDPAFDLGLFLAHLERAEMHRNLPAGRLGPLRDSLLRGYMRASGSISEGRVALYTAAGLLRLAPHPFRNRHPEWPHDIRSTVERAETIVASLRGAATHSRPHTGRAPIPTDPSMPFLAQALDPGEAQIQLRQSLSPLAGDGGTVSILGARMLRHKPARRCLIEYDVVIERPGAPPEAMALLGKARARGLDHNTFSTLTALWKVGFDSASDDGVSVPEPVAVVPTFQMWLHRKVPGVPSTELLAAPGGEDLARRIAEAAHKLHRSGPRPHRRHTMADELSILHEKLPLVAALYPRWRERIESLLRECDRLGASLPSRASAGIHRDFYADQVLVDRSGRVERLYLVDFDLYCQGDPGLDIGNFLAHIEEWALRRLGNPFALAGVEAALLERFVQLSGEELRAPVSVYTLLTLARHVYLSTRFPDREHLTSDLLELCEERFASYAPIAATPAAACAR